MGNITDTATYEVVPCANCGIRFDLPKSYLEERREDGARFHCPNGHWLNYGKNTTARLRKELQASKDAHERTKLCLASANNRADDAKRSANAYKGQATRIKNRVKHGVCPCCNRTFQNLARHMENKHPDFGIEKTEA